MDDFPRQSSGTGRIRILPGSVASQIAAGEVVERPVAVVKELVENSLDAGAARISIAFSEGGRRLIRIEDDGCGMNRDEALLSLERHATSKLREAADLSHIASFGFRGEALPSIASVSRFTLATRDASSPEGTVVSVRAGLLKNVEAVGMTRGTKIEVSDLFHHVPAR
ncbi:MAG TPA: DNA mismatch repair endonuclease MutL, partial [Opitutales bacterium]|nr:DNA mismatch repair endonuclease MutL [Opitutales bacterium]